MEIEEALKKITELEAEKTNLEKETNDLKGELGEIKTKLSEEEKKYIELGNAFKLEKEVNVRMKDFFNNSKPAEPEKTDAEVKAEAYNFISNFRNPKK